MHLKRKDILKKYQLTLIKHILIQIHLLTIIFFDEKEKKLIDLENEDVDPININKSIPGKKIKSIEVLVKLDSENQ